MDEILRIFILFFILVATPFYIKELFGKYFKKADNKPSLVPINPEEKDSDMSMIYEALDFYILRNLHAYTTKDIVFSENSTIDIVPKNHYRDLINALINPKQFIEIEIMDEKIEKQFFTIFLNKVYLDYSAETSNNIKSLLFKYYSGYTKDTYYLDKKERQEPSDLPFVTNYVRNYLWCRHEENENASNELLEMRRAGKNALGADSYEMALKNYDNACCRKLALNIYHANDIVEVSTSTAKNDKESERTVSSFGLKEAKDKMNEYEEKAGGKVK